MPKKREPAYTTLSVRIDLCTREKADKLCDVLRKEKGVRVSRPDAVDIAISEALAKRRK